MRALVINNNTRKEAAQLMAFARRNIYRPGPGAVTPGDDPHFVMRIKMGYRCVFTYTAQDAHLFRHLSISVNGPNYPHPAAIGAIAELFEFTGAGATADIAKGNFPPTWMLHINEQEHCIVLVEDVNHG